MLHHSKTTQTILSSLSRLKEQKKQIASKLMQSINKNSQIYQQHSLSTHKYNQNVLVNRERSVSLLEKKLNLKIKNDQDNTIKLSKVEQETIRKRMEIQKKLAEINNRNALRIQELKTIEEKVIKKIQEDITKNQLKEKQMREEYTRIKNDERKVHQTKIYQKKESYEQWKLLQAEKWRLQNLVKLQEEKHNVLVSSQNPVPTRKQQKKKSEEKYIPNEKQYNKLKRPLNINSKQMGNQYLQQAKMLHREHMMNKNKKKLMNVNLKVIGYNSDIMEKIFRNTSDLSNLHKVAKQPQPQPSPQKDPQQKPVEPQLQEKPKVKFEFKLSQDIETEKYLRQIKASLNELQKQNQNAQPQSSQSLLLPSTNQ